MILLPSAGSPILHVLVQIGILGISLFIKWCSRNIPTEAATCSYHPRKCKRQTKSAALDGSCSRGYSYLPFCAKGTGTMGYFRNSTRWPNRSRVSRKRMRCPRTPAVKRRPCIMLRRHITRNNAKGKFTFEPRRPSVVAFFLGEIHPAVVPRVAVAAFTRLHRHERGPGRVRRCLFEKGTGRPGLILTAVEEG